MESHILEFITILTSPAWETVFSLMEAIRQPSFRIQNTHEHVDFPDWRK